MNLNVRKMFSFDKKILYCYCNNSVWMIVFRVFLFQAKYLNLQCSIKANPCIPKIILLVNNAILLYILHVCTENCGFTTKFLIQNTLSSGKYFVWNIIFVCSAAPWHAWYTDMSSDYSWDIGKNFTQLLHHMQAPL